MAEQRKSCHFSSVLSSAFLEWLLMLLLFLDAFLSFLVRKFVRFSKLQTPCLTCSRLNILGNATQGFYKDLICSTHKLEISSLAYCRIHRKLADAHEMCERCLFSFDTDKKASHDTYKSVAAKLAVDLDINTAENVNLNADATSCDVGPKNKFHHEDTIKAPLLKKDIEPGSLRKRLCSCCSELFGNASHANRLLQRKSVVTDPLHQDGVNERIERPSRPTGANHTSDHSSHTRYSELKVTSDSESEVPYSDVVNGKNVTVDLKEEIVAREKLIDLDPIVSEPSRSVPRKPLLLGESRDMFSLLSVDVIGHGLEEIKWNQVNGRPSPSTPSDILVEQVPKEVTLICPEITDIACTPTSNGELAKALGYPDITLKTIRTINDAYKLSVGKGVMPSPTFAEIVRGRDSARYHEDLKQKLSQISTTRGFEFPSTPSPRFYGQGDEFKFSDASSFTDFLPKRRSELYLDALDGSVVTEIEGENEVDRLKRQVESDRKSMIILYKELEEERSASAIAANQAMAMINRLQAEKAAMQMEALQYLRVMEEQAEYDHEALQKSNDLIAEKEKEVQDLEAEIESFRKRFVDEMGLENVFDMDSESNDKSEHIETLSGAIRS